jgi:hypothetical protein
MKSTQIGYTLNICHYYKSEKLLIANYKITQLTAVACAGVGRNPAAIRSDYRRTPS